MQSDGPMVVHERLPQEISISKFICVVTPYAVISRRMRSGEPERDECKFHLRPSSDAPPRRRARVFCCRSFVFLPGLTGTSRS
jgi:hypothetical protein